MTRRMCFALATCSPGQARLEALFDCHILDTPREELFDHTARHAGYLCGIPIALM
jgi:hypothetical protein